MHITACIKISDDHVCYIMKVVYNITPVLCNKLPGYITCTRGYMARYIPCN